MEEKTLGEEMLGVSFIKGNNNRVQNTAEQYARLINHNEKEKSFGIPGDAESTNHEKLHLIHLANHAVATAAYLMRKAQEL